MRCSLQAHVVVVRIVVVVVMCRWPVPCPAAERRRTIAQRTDVKH